MTLSLNRFFRPAHAGFLVLLLAACSPGAAGPVCGPGPHWVDGCAAGITWYSASANFSLLLLDSSGQPGPAIDVALTGSSRVWRSDAADNIGWYVYPPPPGVGTADGHIDTIATELVSLQLSGSVGSLGTMTMLAGDGDAELGWPPGGWPGGPPPLFSAGYMLEQAGNPTVVDSFFDIFFEIDIGGEIWRNQSPLRLHAVVTQDPMPHVTFSATLTNTTLSLFRAGETMPVANIYDHFSYTQDIPEPATLGLTGAVLAALVLARRLRRN